MKYKFPEGFLWGGAQAAEQAEGHGITKKGKTVWDKLFDDEPSLFYNGVGPSTTNDLTRHHVEDADLYNEIGANSIRHGFSWARLFPDGKNVDQEAVKFYHDYLDNLNKKGVKVIMTLFHFDMPLWAGEKNGWENNEVIDSFVNFARFCFNEYGDKVFKYATHNEPIVPIMAGYMGGAHYPRLDDSKRAFQAGFGTILSHAKVVKVFNDEFRSKLNAEIGVVINVAPAYAKAPGVEVTKEDENAAHMFNVLHNFAMLDPMILGTFPRELKEFAERQGLMPTYSRDEIEIINATKIDFVGVNFYAPARVQAPKDAANAKDAFSAVADGYEWPEKRKNVFRGWEIYPEALYDAAQLIKTRYNNIPFYVSENGMGVQNEDIYRDEAGVIQDDYRIAFVQEHLVQIHRAIQDGANAFGYHMWAITDNWSWANAYKNRYGYIEINVDTQERKIKKSGYWHKSVADANGFDEGFKTIEETIDLDNVKFEESLNGRVEKED